MLPKHLIPASPGPECETSMHVSSEADDDDEGAGGVDGSPCTRTSFSALIQFWSHYALL